VAFVETDPPEVPGFQVGRQVNAEMAANPGEVEGVAVERVESPVPGKFAEQSPSCDVPSDDLHQARLGRSEAHDGRSPGHFGFDVQVDLKWSRHQQSGVPGHRDMCDHT
jgi:hypothetical protein